MRDLRKYARQTNARLIVGGIFLAFVVAIGLIYALYGPAAAVSGAVCFLAGLAPLLLIAIALWGIDWYVKKKADEDEEDDDWMAG